MGELLQRHHVLMNAHLCFNHPMKVTHKERSQITSTIGTNYHLRPWLRGWGRRGRRGLTRSGTAWRRRCVRWARVLLRPFLGRSSPWLIPCAPWWAASPAAPGRSTWACYSRSPSFGVRCPMVPASKNYCKLEVYQILMLFVQESRIALPSAVYMIK